MITRSSAPNPWPCRARCLPRRAPFALVLLAVLLLAQPSFAGRTAAGPRPPTLGRLVEGDRAGAGLLNPPASVQPAALTDDSASLTSPPSAIPGRPPNPLPRRGEHFRPPKLAIFPLHSSPSFGGGRGEDK